MAVEVFSKLGSVVDGAVNFFASTPWYVQLLLLVAVVVLIWWIIGMNRRGM
jgi:hypothetical protein